MPTNSPEDLRTLHKQRVAAIEAALAQCRADVAAGRFIVESAQAHAARLDALLAAGEAVPCQVRPGPQDEADGYLVP
jgi:hypothetical protein